MDLAVYVNRNGESWGPYSWEELCGHYQSGAFLATDLAWHEGLPEWKTLGEILAPQSVGPAPVTAPPVAPSIKAIGPLHMANPLGHNTLADPSALSTGTPAATPKPTKQQRPENKPSKLKIKRQDIQLPSWSKWAVVGTGVILIGIGVYRIGGTPNVDREEQIYGQSVRNALNQQSGELKEDDFEKVNDLNLSSKGITELDFLTRSKDLVKLNLAGNKITDLAPLLELSKLEELDVSQNEINDFTPLERIKTLKKLQISNNPGNSKVTVDILKRALPDCEITSK